MRTGCLKTCAVDPNGREHVLNFHFVGEIIGIDAIFPGQHFSDAIALVESSVCHLPYRAISQLAREIPELQVQVVRALSRHVFSMTSISGDFSAEERLAAFLVMVSARHRLAGGGSTELQLAMSRQDIANYLRLATETVSRILARFQKSGLLRANRRQITLLNPDGLYAIAECMNPYSAAVSTAAARSRAQPAAETAGDNMANERDVVIIGAGPAGLSLAIALADAGFGVTVVEKLPHAVLADPPADGREIALTHRAVDILQSLGMWQNFPAGDVSPIREARVLDGKSPHFLGFDTRGTQQTELGYLVPNNVIRKAAFEVAASKPSVEIISDVAVSGVGTTADAAEVRLADGRILAAPLMVAADSRFSDARRRMGIGADMRDFGRTVIVCRLSHELPHNGIAHECFYYGRTLAVLPLHGLMSSAVITLSADQSNAMLQMPVPEFEKLRQRAVRITTRSDAAGRRTAQLSAGRGIRPALCHPPLCTAGRCCGRHAPGYRTRFQLRALRRGVADPHGTRCARRWPGYRQHVGAGPLPVRASAGHPADLPGHQCAGRPVHRRPDAGTLLQDGGASAREPAAAFESDALRVS